MNMGAILIKWPGPFEQTLDTLLPRCRIWNLIEIGPAVSEEKSFEKVDKHSILAIFGKGHWLTLTFDIHRGSCSALFHITDHQFLKNAMYHLFPHSIAQGTKVDLDKNKSRSTWGHHLKKLSGTQ